MKKNNIMMSVMPPPPPPVLYPAAGPVPVPAPSPAPHTMMKMKTSSPITVIAVPPTKNPSTENPTSFLTNNTIIDSNTTTRFLLSFMDYNEKEEQNFFDNKNDMDDESSTT